MHFLTRGPTGEMYLPPGCIPAKSECGRHFLWEGGLQLEGFSGLVPYNVTMGRLYTRALAYYSQGGPGRSDCDQWEASVDCNNYGLTGPLPDHAWRPVSFVCVFLYRPSNLYRKFIM